MKKHPKKIAALCLLLYLAWGFHPIAGETKESSAKIGVIDSVSCVIFTVQNTSHAANEIRKPVDNNFFPEIQKLMEKFGVKKEALIFRSPCFQNGNYYFIVRVDKKREDDPIIGKMNSAILGYSLSNAIILKSIEHLIE